MKQINPMSTYRINQAKEDRVLGGHHTTRQPWYSSIATAFTNMFSRRNNMISPEPPPVLSNALEIKSDTKKNNTWSKEDNSVTGERIQNKKLLKELNDPFMHVSTVNHNSSGKVTIRRGSIATDRFVFKTRER